MDYFLDGMHDLYIQYKSWWPAFVCAIGLLFVIIALTYAAMRSEDADKNKLMLQHYLQLTDKEVTNLLEIPSIDAKDMDKAYANMEEFIKKTSLRKANEIGYFSVEINSCSKDSSFDSWFFSTSAKG